MTVDPAESVDRHFAEEAELTCLRLPALELTGLGPAELVGVVEDPNEPLERRLGAGAVLAIAGDPRLQDRPRLSPVEGGRVVIGTRADEVDAVTARWRGVGVQRDWIAKESPPYETTLRSFWIGTFPVTNGEYRRFLHESGHPTRPSHWYLGAYPWERSNHPVCGLSAEDADAYVRWLSAALGHPFRLPTEAEWEHAAKGPAGHEFPWGDTYDPAYANTRETGIHTTTPVGAFPQGRSPFGALDMAGNVEEYCADLYRPYPGGSAVSDHLTETFGTYRICRGGSFARYADLARTRRRHGPFPGALYPCGLRVATDTELP